METTDRPTPTRVCVLGNGGWGTALALSLLRNGHDVVLWGHSAEEMAKIRALGENETYLPGVPVPPSLRLEVDPAAALRGASIVVLAIPSHFLEATCAPFRGLLAPGADVVSVAKGFTPGSSDRLSVAAARALGIESVAVLAGPSHAEEVSRGVPTVLVSASKDPEQARRIQAVFSSDRLRVYTSDDPAGVEIGGAVKNVLAVAVGVSDGLGFGDNTRAALITRGLSEMARFGVALGGSADTFAGLGGVGDLIVTCTSRHSRNRRVGERLGRGETLAAIRADMKQVAEGVWNCPIVCALAKKNHIEMPICESVLALLEGRADPKSVCASLMGRSSKAESWGS